MNDHNKAEKREREKSDSIKRYSDHRRGEKRKGEWLKKRLMQKGWRGELNCMQER